MRPSVQASSLGFHFAKFGLTFAEIIGVLFSVELIWVVTGVLVYLAAQRVRSMSFEVEAKPMLITATFGVLVNIL